MNKLVFVNFLLIKTFLTLIRPYFLPLNFVPYGISLSMIVLDSKEIYGFQDASKCTTIFAPKLILVITM